MGGIKMTRKKSINQKLIGIDRYCPMCNIEKDLSSFYVTKNQLFKVGRVPYCIECLNNIDTDNTKQVKKILALIDKPYIHKTWVNSGVTSASTGEKRFGVYYRVISSFGHSADKTWEDSVFEDTGDTLEKAENNVKQSGEFSNEGKNYNAKWMGNYTQSDIEYLEDYYLGLDRDFKIVTTSHKDYARKICKASLHMDKCFQEVLEGSAGADTKYKASRETFDTLSKSAQFSESQRGQNDVGLGNFGVTFDQVEQNKWIPKHIPIDEDAIGKMIQQFASIKDSV